MVDTPADRSQPANSATRARSGTSRAEMWGTASKPSPSSCSVISQVASWPLAGDAVTDTRAPAGRASTAASRLFSGMTSKVRPSISRSR